MKPGLAASSHSSEGDRANPASTEGDLPSKACAALAFPFLTGIRLVRILEPNGVLGTLKKKRQLFLFSGLHLCTCPK